MAKDPYRYFRVEARELLDGLSQGILALEKGDTGRELVARLLRLAHTLKGAARVVKQGEVAELAHAIEDVLAPIRDSGTALPPDQIGRLLALVDACGERLKPVLAIPGSGSAPTATGIPPPIPTSERAAQPVASSSPATEETAASVRIDIAEVDTILYDLADAGVRLEAIHRELASLERTADTVSVLIDSLAPAAGGTGMTGRSRSDRRGPETLRALAEEVRGALRGHHRALQAGIDRTRTDLGRVRDRVGELRLLPAREIFPPLERAVRDAADALKKRVVFQPTGGEHRLDAHVLLSLRDALIHVVRNAVAHGIEDGPERAAKDKPRDGRVRLRVRKQAGRVHFVVEDDGRGIDVAAVRRVMIDRKLATPEGAGELGLAEATQVLFRGGVSTAATVSEVMGRGVGLDVVRATAARFKGDADLRSEPGRGTTVEITVPVSLESLDVLTVVAGTASGLIPFDAVRRTIRLTGADLVRTATGPALYWDGQEIPFRPLAEIQNAGAPGPAGTWTAVVVQSRGGPVAVGVDRLGGVRNVVVRPLPALAGVVPLAAGAALDAAGDPQLVLDPDALGEAVRATPSRVTEAPARPPLSVLVIDDSLTSRMLEQSILETAGYQVDTATSGEEGLEMARAKRYAAFVVDVEMPGMNGFEVLKRFRADPALHATPAVLVTSLATPEDRRRGELAGARAHIAKGEFDEGQLLRTIRGLVGESTP